MNRQIVIFSTTDIFRTSARFPGQEPKAHIDDDLERPCYSTGKLEQALEEGHVIVVVTTRRSLYPHDAWWFALVEQDNVFLANSASKDDASNCLPAWQYAYHKLGIAWPEEISNQTQARDHLLLQPNIMPASRLKGFEKEE
jgi:hypothetical protein